MSLRPARRGVGAPAATLLSNGRSYTPANGVVRFADIEILADLELAMARIVARRIYPGGTDGTGSGAGRYLAVARTAAFLEERFASEGFADVGREDVRALVKCILLIYVFVIYQ